jgi:outer membrane protein OmpA-like peptidoglycan-associated protein
MRQDQQGGFPMAQPISKILIMLISAVFVVACSTINPYTGEEQTSKATKGALIGAAAGLVVGLVTGDDAVDRRQRALLGAGIGALAGGSIGYYMDVQEAKLRQKMAGTGVSVTRIGNNITLNMPGNITFATASADLNADFFRVLNGVSEVVSEYEQTLVEVAGHTDSRGSAEYNQALSERRADSVAAYMESQGIVPLRVITVGMGEGMPVADNSTADGQTLNRRVELTLVPLTG